MRKLSGFIKTQQTAKSISEMSEGGIALFNFLTLMVDINHRARYGKNTEWSNGKRKSNDMTLPGQLTSVDDVLEDERQQRLSDANR